jgi:outer membrane protein assembly factor BamB
VRSGFRARALHRTAAVALAGVLLGVWLPAPTGGAQVAPKASWTTYGFDLARTGSNPTERRLTVDDVDGLQRAWQVDLGGASITQPLVVADLPLPVGPRTVVFVGTEHGDVEAVRDSGAVQWHVHLGSAQTDCLQMPGGVFGVGGTPVFDPATGRLYVAVNDDTSGEVLLHALDAATGEPVPGWPVPIGADAAHEHVWGALTLFEGRVYYTIAGMCDHEPYSGRVGSVDTATGEVRTWSVLSGGQGGGIWGYGGVSVEDGSIWTATGNALAPLAQDEGYAERVVRLSPDLEVLDSTPSAALSGEDVDFGSTPLVFERPGCPAQVAALNKSGVLLLYLRDTLSAGPVQRLVLGRNLGRYGRLIGIPAYSGATRRLFVANPGPERRRFVRGLVALRETHRCRLTPVWQQPEPSDVTKTMSTPTVAGGVVYYGDGLGGHVLARSEATGEPLWDSGASLPGPVFAAPVVANGRLYVASWDGSGGGVLTKFRPVPPRPGAGAGEPGAVAVGGDGS